LLNEDFAGKELNTKNWQPENWLNFKMSGVSFSQDGEKQSFNGLNNLKVNNNTLLLVAKGEKVNGMVWNPAVGLAPKSFDYSSSIINTANFFRLKEGVIEAKLRFKKDATITSAFSLTGDMPFPQIDLVRSTQKGVGMGIVEKQGEGSSKYIQLSGLNDENYHIYRLELWNNELVWKINDYEIFRCYVNLNETLFFNLLTTLHGEVNDHLLPHNFEVGWIRCYSLKS
jgi:beta-glucanase (GH16 family)